MAFTTRSKRLVTKVENPWLGPGKYRGHTSYTFTRSFAPFQTTAVKGFLANQRPNTTPGPGTYALEIAETSPLTVPLHSHHHADQGQRAAGGGPLRYAVGSYAHSVPNLSSCFRPTGPRLSVLTTHTRGFPGPGAYERTDRTEWVKKSPNHKYYVEGLRWDSDPVALRHHAAVFVRGLIDSHPIGIAPTVPGRRQCKGYEDGDDGRLVPIGPGFVGYTGVGADKPGPGMYNSNFELVVPAPRTTDFAASRLERALYSKMDTGVPGPGSYDVFIDRMGGMSPANRILMIENSEESLLKSGSSKSFLRSPGSVRIDGSAGGGGSSVVGGGSGSFGTQLGVSRWVTKESSFFVSGVPKFKHVVKDTPGPGTYTLSRVFDFAYREQPMSPSACATRPFGTAQSRGYHIDPDKVVSPPTYLITPGPGAYAPKIVEGKEDHIWSTSLGPDETPSVASPFSFTSQRFSNFITFAPGPGSYDVPIVHPRRTVKSFIHLGEPPQAEGTNLRRGFTRICNPGESQGPAFMSTARRVSFTDIAAAAPATASSTARGRKAGVDATAGSPKKKEREKEREPDLEAVDRKGMGNRRRGRRSVMNSPQGLRQRKVVVHYTGRGEELSSVFASDTTRFGTTGTLHGGHAWYSNSGFPCPGTYETPIRWSTKPRPGGPGWIYLFHKLRGAKWWSFPGHHRKDKPPTSARVFVSGAPRLHHHFETDSPGPGRYEPRAAGHVSGTIKLQELRPSLSRSFPLRRRVNHGFSTTCPRFLKKLPDNPGPGTYFPEDSHTLPLLKPSFNVTISPSAPTPPVGKTFRNVVKG